MGGNELELLRRSRRLDALRIVALARLGVAAVMIAALFVGSKLKWPQFDWVPWFTTGKAGFKPLSVQTQGHLLQRWRHLARAGQSRQCSLPRGAALEQPQHGQGRGATCVIAGANSTVLVAAKRGQARFQRYIGRRSSR